MTQIGPSTGPFCEECGAIDGGIGRLVTTDNDGALTSGESGTPGVPDVVLTSGYDLNGNRTSLSASIGGAPGASGARADFQNTYSFDALDREVSVSQQSQTGSSANAVAGKRVDFGFNLAGDTATIARFSAGNLVASSAFAYDGAGRLTNLTHFNADTSQTYADYAWTFDAANRAQTFSSAVDGTVTYGYDPTGQLTSADYSSGYTGSPTNESVSFDANGNRTGGSFSLNSSGHGNNQIASDGTWTYTYDNNGNLTEQASSTAQIDYAYDFRNRLTEVTEKTVSSGVATTTEVLDYVYDMYNDLISRKVTPYTGGSPGTPTANQHFAFDGPNMVLAFDGTGKITDRYLWGPVVDQILADEQYSSSAASTAPTSAGTTLWPLTDDEGSVRDVLKYDAGTNTVTSVEHIVYNSFGKKLSDTGSVTLAFGYNGTYTDVVTADQLHGLRWYDPARQRWISQDPAGMTYDSNPCRGFDNSPTNGIDPSGLVDAWDMLAIEHSFDVTGYQFDTASDAAAFWGRQYNGASIIIGREMNSTIYRGRDHKYHFTPPNVGTNASSVPSKPTECDVTPVATVHSHGKYEAGFLNNQFSGADLANSRRRGLNIYVATPNGSLQVYDYSTDEVTLISNDMPSDPSDPDRKNKQNPSP
jgi:RHS repeat-associated protein